MKIKKIPLHSNICNDISLTLVSKVSFESSSNKSDEITMVVSILWNLKLERQVGTQINARALKLKDATLVSHKPEIYSQRMSIDLLPRIYRLIASFLGVAVVLFLPVNYIALWWELVQSNSFGEQQRTELVPAWFNRRLEPMTPGSIGSGSRGDDAFFDTLVGEIC